VIVDLEKAEVETIKVKIILTDIGGLNSKYELKINVK